MQHLAFYVLIQITNQTCWLHAPILGCAARSHMDGTFSYYLRETTKNLSPNVLKKRFCEVRYIKVICELSEEFDLQITFVKSCIIVYAFYTHVTFIFQISNIAQRKSDWID